MVENLLRCTIAGAQQQQQHLVVIGEF